MSSSSSKDMRGAHLHLSSFRYCNHSSTFRPSFHSPIFFPAKNTPEIKRRKRFFPRSGRRFDHAGALRPPQLSGQGQCVSTGENFGSLSGFSSSFREISSDSIGSEDEHDDIGLSSSGRFLGNEVVNKDSRASDLGILNPKQENGNVLRAGLDLCSKIGDVMGAISLYDLAKKEGIKMGQYHYSVLLYLCSSAASGTVKPAKSGKQDEIGSEIQVNEELKATAIARGLEIYNEMLLENVPMNEAIYTSAARMAMAFGDGELAFEIVKKMKACGVEPKLRSYTPALSIFCRKVDVSNAFKVEGYMSKHGVHPEEPELQALLRVSIETGSSDKVYYTLHKLRASVGKLSPSTADLLQSWFLSGVASRVGKRKWDPEFIRKVESSVGGGWHGEGWLGRGKWDVRRCSVGRKGVCGGCGKKMVNIDLDPTETEKFADSVASIASRKERNSGFEKFQKWLEYYGPFEAVVDAANVGLNNHRKFTPSKVKAVVNGIRQMLPSRKWPLIVLHNRRITGGRMDEPFNKSLIEKWRNADAIYATPTGSNDDWYWLYAAIKMRCLIVTNDEMRDHLFQLLGDDFFPKWKERHQVHFSFDETGPVFHMPPPYSVVLQESVQGHWHIPIASRVEREEERIWLCCTRPSKNKTEVRKHDQAEEQETSLRGNEHGHARSSELPYRRYASILHRLKAAEKYGAYTADFQI